ncbi:Glia-derived nexin [Thelohanellus kitauei]|uniref:Glia-derived nexin n=1 Tax=Thelohanellus kitauei TaxID=669202 RepID=A0A0C2IMM6_THEKT|nr:Glia-derived nexin [Thelohanellus kitauei]
MSADMVNRFTSNILNELYASQNRTGNVALSGISLYLLLGAINVGLKGRSHEQLQGLLAKNFDNTFDNETWVNSDNAEKWNSLSYMAQYISSMKSVLFYSCPLNQRYQQISDLIFRLHKIKINFSNISEASPIIKKWASRNTNGWIRNIFDESTLSKDVMIFIYSLFIRAVWRTQFNPSLTKQEIFFDDKGKPQEVPMMNQGGMYLVYDLPDHNFWILFNHFTDSFLISITVLPRDDYSIDDVLKKIKVFLMFKQLDEMHIYLSRAMMKYVSFKMPRFKILVLNDYVTTLMHFGITDIFHGHLADFGNMTNHSVFIRNMKQCINISIDESGVNANDYNEATVEESLIETKEDFEEIARISPSDLFEDIAHTDERSHAKTDEFYLNRPFLFFLYSSPARLVHFSAVVNNLNGT